MKPIGKYIVVQNVEEEIKTQSGLILSGEDTNQLRYKKGVVVESGTDVSTIDSGDEIYYDKSTSFTMVINNEQYTIIQERDVVVVL
jgi:co-chaperonin GroES (HSP10)